MNVAGKTALVTGGTEGIGLEIARQLMAKGATVIVCGRRQAQLEAARAEGLEAVTADLSSAAGCAALAAEFGARPLDILINNAGAGSEIDLNGPVDLEGNDRIIFLNFNAPFHLICHLLTNLRARPEAAIVNVTSGLAIAPRALSPIYCATKAGLRSLTQSLRFLLKDSNIRVTEALPPVVDTQMTAGRSGGKMSAPDCARAILTAVERGSATANIGMTKILAAVHSISPALARAIMIRF